MPLQGGVIIQNLDKKINIIKKAGIFLISSLLVLSATTVIAIDSKTIAKTYKEESTDKSSDILLQEGFEEGIMPPTGWTLSNTQSAPYTWHIIDDTDVDVGVHSGTYAAKVKRYIVSHQDEKLTTPEMDLTGYSDISLEFWAASWTWNPTATVKVIVQGDGISDVIWDMIADEHWETVEYRNVTLDLSAYADETIKICFEYVGIQGWNFGLDDIVIYAGEQPIPPELQIDLIYGGWAGIGKGGLVTAQIKNVASADAEDATDVQWTISVIGNGLIRQINESGEGTIQQISPQESSQIDLIVGHHFGMINITITAYEPHFDILSTESVEGIILIGYVLIR